MEEQDLEDLQFVWRRLENRDFFGLNRTNVDLYFKFNPGKVHFTWKRQGVNKSRLDRVYYPESKVGEVVKFNYVTHSSDHDASVWVTRGEVQRVKESKTKSYWKLNAAVLSEVNFDVNGGKG